MGRLLTGLTLALTFSLQAFANDVCLTPDCVKRAATILNALDEAVNPCEDFFQFTCGSWIKYNPLPDDKASYGTFTKLRDRNQIVLKNIFDSPYPADNKMSPEEAALDRKTFEKIQNYYKSCMNTAQVEDRGLAPLTGFLKKLVKKSLPLAKEETKGLDKQMFTQLVLESHLHSFNVFFPMYVSADSKNPDVNIITIGQGGLNLPSKEYYNDSSVTETYAQVMESVFKLVLPDVVGTTENYKPIVESVIAFETKLAQYSKKRDELRDPTVRYNLYKVKDLPALFPALDWDMYLEGLFPKKEYGSVLTPESNVIVTVPTFQANVSRVILETHPQALEYYTYWSVIKSFGKSVPKNVTDIIDILNEKTGSRAKTEPPRYETCLVKVDGVMGDVAGKWFVNQEFAGDSKKAAESMIDMVKKSMLKRLPDIDWIDEPTRLKAVEKVHSLGTKIGYPEFIMSPKEADEKYRSLSFKATEFFENEVNYFLYDSNRGRHDLLKPVDKSEWHMTASTVNATPVLNEIVFPAGILQPPFYGAEDPSYLNFGAIGMVVGHELTHAFDDSGRRYDSQGKLNDWWTPNTAKEFESLTKCFIDQYNNYSISFPTRSDSTMEPKTQNVNGLLTLGENLADSGGIIRAWQAWKTDLDQDRSKKRNFKLPGLDKYTMEQLFFIGFGQLWCSQTKDERQLQYLRTDPHSPAQFRVNGVVSHSTEFAKAFNCPTESPMNSAKKCAVW